MVQGNWERRAELASKRRIEAKQKKAEVTKKNVFESSYNKLSKEDDYSDYRVWLSPLDDRGTCCSSWLRFEMCSKKKKCKLPHVGVGLPELLIDGETSLPPSEESIDVEESNVDTAVLLASISSRDVSRIRFIALGRELIFDYKCDDIWESWYCKRKSKTGVMIPQKILNCIVEDEEGEIEEGKGDRLTVSLSQQSMRILLRVFSSASIAFCVIKYLNNNEVLYFSECSKRLRNSIFYENRDPEDPFRRCLGLRLKEAISFQNSKTKGEMSAMKKMEKKKKSKQSHLKLTDKKDAFARRGMFS